MDTRQTGLTDRVQGRIRTLERTLAAFIAKPRVRHPHPRFANRSRTMRRNSIALQLRSIKALRTLGNTENPYCVALTPEEYAQVERWADGEQHE